MGIGWTGACQGPSHFDIPTLIIYPTWSPRVQCSMLRNSGIEQRRYANLYYSISTNHCLRYTAHSAGIRSCVYCFTHLPVLTSVLTRNVQ